MCADLLCPIQISSTLYRPALLNSVRRIETYSKAQRYKATPLSAQICSSLYKSALNYIYKLCSNRFDASNDSEKRTNIQQRHDARCILKSTSAPFAALLYPAAQQRLSTLLTRTCIVKSTCALLRFSVLLDASPPIEKRLAR